MTRRQQHDAILRQALARAFKHAKTGDRSTITRAIRLIDTRARLLGIRP